MVARSVFGGQLEQWLECWALGVELEQLSDEHEQQHRSALRFARQLRS